MKKYSRVIIPLGASVIVLGCSVLNYFSDTGPSTILPAQPDLSAEDFPPSETPAPAATLTEAFTITPSRTPTASPIAEYGVEVPADVVWFNTKVALSAGQYMEIKASGKSNISGVPGNSVWGPDGDQGYCPLDCLLPGAGYGTLIGKYPGKLPFRVGSFFKSEVEADAVLLLAINDNEPYYFDNTGSYSVRITVWKNPPAGS